MEVRSEAIRRHSGILFDVLRKAYANFKQSLEAFGTFDLGSSPTHDDPFSNPFGGSAAYDRHVYTTFIPTFSLACSDSSDVNMTA